MAGYKPHYVKESVVANDDLLGAEAEEEDLLEDYESYEEEAYSEDVEKDLDEYYDERITADDLTEEEIETARKLREEQEVQVSKEQDRAEEEIEEKEETEEENDAEEYDEQDIDTMSAEELFQRMEEKTKKQTQKQRIRQELLKTYQERQEQRARAEQEALSRVITRMKGSELGFVRNILPNIAIVAAIFIPFIGIIAGAIILKLLPPNTKENESARKRAVTAIVLGAIIFLTRDLMFFTILS